MTQPAARSFPHEYVPLELPAVDVTRRTVRILRKRDNGFIEFEFSVGWPELMVELMLMQADFDEFCQRQRAQILPAH